jgi:hypothetical protein
VNTFTIEDIRSWKPCYDPVKHLPEGWSGTALDIIKNESIPFNDALWVVCRDGILSDKTMRLFAVWCARSVEHLLTDERSKNAINVAEKYANGLATDDNLRAAWDAAWDAARDAAWAAAWDAQRKALIEIIEKSGGGE